MVHALRARRYKFIPHCHLWIRLQKDIIRADQEGEPSVLKQSRELNDQQNLHFPVREHVHQ